MATRFGASAIIIVAWYPLFRLAPELCKAVWTYELPELTSQMWVVWILLGLAVVMTPLAFASALSVILPLFRHLEGSKGFWRIVASGVATALAIYIYVALLAIIGMGSEWSGELIGLAKQLTIQDSACGPTSLRGQACEDAINAILTEID
ncbi:MAG: hypothetical protein Q4G22_02410 [Paracoccus sp. (in: a-proteobacteria)]|uniref:hypothetical protein n=1 Tax=Paracoccus sp. TaxID=267 RepID=UPI0026E0C507|nr:hypothetical protein [Paracoccus sp. (in: a-proteobacteria)]MDO5630670.1 hypothetical protein [Paracoccus sp. (in: a-proteobacteria)]